MFGEDEAFNLNSHVYNKDAVGIYLSVRYSKTQKAESEMPTIIGSILGGAYYALAVVGGAGLGIGGMALIQRSKKKREEEIVEETTTEEIIDDVVGEETAEETTIEE
jgi:hypothetical protein